MTKKVCFRMECNGYPFVFLITMVRILHSSFFFQNKEIFVQLDELDDLNRITHACNSGHEAILLATQMIQHPDAIQAMKPHCWLHK